ncbi:MAG TPA: fumarylacetoacetate hydrolase family protein [Bosea sp. (in: a-proteobacteria)]|jgi:2-keto-4-pentenoate hydratase|uniref:2-keto-4-pentenoate hydratase n=1 Tax=Bosea sp. (in: a-proteobacteria) TaxID=1871050 RepID=UPI002E11A530|nr:fumarylacetoacetate hydrolase family protein [Bosea sp. (in: a-proteobacteria)]
MQANSLDDLAAGLARNRIAGLVADLRLDGLHSKAEAAAVQTAALDAYADDFAGYVLVGTSELSRRGLGLSSPIFAPLADRALFGDGWRIHLPQGMIGAQCELAFTLGRAYPERGESIDRHSAADAILACQPAIGLLGRRVRPGTESELAAIADFALHVATVCGPLVEPADKDSLDRAVMTARIDGKTVVTAKAGTILGHPLEALVWLAQKLARHNRQLNAGDVVTIGSCAPILQVLPGQHLTVEFEMIGTASCWFD